MNLLLVGAGQLGSRHLQSVLKYSKSLNIVVVDRSECSLTVARNRALEIKTYNKHSVKFLTDLKDVKETTFKFFILATGASVRYKIFKDALCRFKIEYVILEKVLFQDIDSYDLASKLIEKLKIKVFVNCPLRVYPFFRELKRKYISAKHKTIFRYSGGDWVGLACNAIHYIDLMSFLCSEKLLSIDVKGLDDGFIESKRPGNVEFTGKILGVYSRGGELSIESIRGSEQESIIKVSNGNYQITIDEILGKYSVYKDDILVEGREYEVIYQSDLTHRILEKIEKTGECELIEYSDSALLHKEMISNLLAHYNRFAAVKSNVLPVT